MATTVSTSRITPNSSPRIESQPPNHRPFILTGSSGPGTPVRQDAAPTVSLRKSLPPCCTPRPILLDGCGLRTHDEGRPLAHWLAALVEKIRAGVGLNRCVTAHMH